MEISTLKLTHFKNYTAETFQFCGALNCLVGLNGMGKTNVLDAIHFLCLTKSHRSIPDKSLLLHDAPFLRVEGIFQNDSATHKLVVKMPADKRKELEVNGTVIGRLADHIGKFPAVMIAPDDVALVQEGSEERRRYLDSTLSQISADYLGHLMQYNALIKQRNALLKNFGTQRHFEPLVLEAIDQQLPRPAKAIHEARVALLVQLKPLFESVYAAIAGDNEVPDMQLDSDWPEDGDYPAFLHRQMDKDRMLERTTTGPHRDDLVLSINDMPARKFASQGQLKSFLLALRLAQYEILRLKTGVSPILLLDDIFDKLDQERVEHLVGLLLDRSVGQVFITDTHRGRMEAVIAGFQVEFKVFEVKNGAIVPALNL